MNGAAKGTGKAGRSVIPLVGLFLLLFLGLGGLVSEGVVLATTARQVKDIQRGSGSSLPQSFGLFNGTTFFAANDGINGPELWMTDGTTGGTVLVKDIYPGSYGSGPRYLTVYSGRLFFSAEDATHGEELWV